MSMTPFWSHTPSKAGNNLLAYLVKKEGQGRVITPRQIHNLGQSAGYENLLRIGFIEEVTAEAPNVPGSQGQMKTVKVTPEGRVRFFEQKVLMEEEVDLTYQFV